MFLLKFLWNIYKWGYKMNMDSSSNYLIIWWEKFEFILRSQTWQIWDTEEISSETLEEPFLRRNVWGAKVFPFHLFLSMRKKWDIKEIFFLWTCNSNIKCKSTYNYKGTAFCALKATTDILGGKKKKKSPADVDVDWQCWNLMISFLMAFHKTRTEMNRKRLSMINSMRITVWEK